MMMTMNTVALFFALTSVSWYSSVFVKGYVVTKTTPPSSFLGSAAALGRRRHGQYSRAAGGFLRPEATRRAAAVSCRLGAAALGDDEDGGDMLDDRNRQSNNSNKLPTGKFLASSALCGMLLLGGIGTITNPHPAAAYNPTDYASDTVVSAVKSLEAAAGNVDDTFKAYEEIAAIVTEGKGVGGEINYKGVQLDRGYIADEDTSIYNPGLTLLTESEKERLVDAIVTSRNAGLQKGQWNEDAQLGFDFLRMRLDPYHMYELRGYLKVVPFVVAVAYVGVTAVQQFVRGLFPIAYFLGVAVVVLPAVVLVLAGP